MTRGRMAILATVLLVFVLAGAFYVIAYTQVGIELVAAQLSRLDRLGIRIDGVSGRLTGPLRIARFELDNDSAHVVAEDIVIDLHLRWLALQNLDITRASVGTALIELKTAPEKPPPLTPPRFLPGFLSISIDRADLSAITLQLANGQAIAIDHVSTGARIRAGRISVNDFVVDAPQFSALGNVVLIASRPLAIEASASGKVSNAGSADLDLAAVVKGTTDALQIDADLRAPAVVHVSSRFTRSGDSWQFDGNIAAAQFALAPWVPENGTVFNDVALDFSMRPDVIQLTGKLTVPEVDTAPLMLDATGRYAERTLFIAAATVAHTGSQARLNIAGQVAFDEGAPTLNIAADWASVQWPLSTTRPLFASPSGRLSVSGPLPYEFTASAEVSGQQLPALSGQVNGLVSNTALMIDRYDLKLLDGTLSGAGSIEFAAPRRWTLSATGAGINPVALHEEFPGSLDFAATANGAGTTPQADFTLAVARIRGMLRGQPLSGSGKVQRDQNGWRVQDTALTFGNARLTLAGTIRDTLDLRWTFNATSLATLWPGAGGNLRFNGSAAGPWRLPHIVADINAAGLKYGDWSIDALDADINVDPSGKADSALKVDVRTLRQGALQAESIHLSGSGNPGAHTLRAQVASRATRGALTTAELEISGRYVDETWAGQIASGRLLDAAGKQPLRLAQPARVVVSRNHVDVAQLCLYLVESSICGSGQWQRNGPWHVDATGDKIPLGVLGELLNGQPQYLGQMDLDLTAQGSPSIPWRGDVSVVLTGGAIVYRLVDEDATTTETVQLGSGRADLSATADSISAIVGLSATAETFIAANATLARLPGIELGRSPLSGRVRARMGDTNLIPVLVAEIDHAAGVLTADVTLSGQLDAPQINGRIDINRGELDLYRLNLALRQIELGVDLTANSLRLAGSARAGDGSLNVEGTMVWKDRLPGGTLHIKGENLLVADLPEYRVVASPDLAFNIDGRNINASGEVLIPTAQIQPRDLSGAVQISPDSRLVQEEPLAESSRFNVSSEIRIRLGDDVRLDTFGLQGKLGGAVTTTTRTGDIAVGRGELAVADGKYDAYGQKLEISRGRLLFDASPLDDPGLDIQAERMIETVKVGLNVRGTLREPRLGFYSEPSMSQTQIMSYLLVGKPIDDLQGSDAATVGSAQETLTVQGGGFLAAQLGRRFGIEEVGVQSEGENQTSLVLGKFLSPRLFVSYGISLTESINTLKLRYTITDRWVLKTEAGEEQSADIEFTIERP